MDEVKIFENPEFGNIRVIFISGEPWFVAKDIANNLGYQNGSRDVNRHVFEEDRIKDMVFDGTQNKETILINESGLYALILSSKLESAKRFKHWVTSEVLPSIRKTGSYNSKDHVKSQAELNFERITDPDSIIAICENWKKDIEAKEAAEQKLLETTKELESTSKELGQAEQKLSRQKPAIDFVKQVVKCDDGISMSMMAKMLCDDGVNIGSKRLFKFLRGIGVLQKNNEPYQKYVNEGKFKVRLRRIYTPYNTVKVNATLYVTGKGQIWVSELVRKYYTG